MAVVVIAAVVVTVVDLASDLASTDGRGMDVHVGPSLADQGNHLCKVCGTGDTVRRLGNDVGLRERPGHSPVLEVVRVTLAAERRRCNRRSRQWCGRGITQPQNDIPRILRIADVDVRLPGVAFEVLEGARTAFGDSTKTGRRFTARENGYEPRDVRS
jgi:hypothetical protein